jgi:hypothetical protein
MMKVMQREMGVLHGVLLEQLVVAMNMLIEVAVLPDQEEGELSATIRFKTILKWRILT